MVGGLDPGNRDFFGHCEMAWSPLDGCNLGPKKADLPASKVVCTVPYYSEVFVQRSPF